MRGLRQASASWRVALAVGAAVALMQCGGSSGEPDAGVDAGVDAGAGGGTGTGGGVGTGGGTGGGGGCTQVVFPPESVLMANHVPRVGMNPPWDWALFTIPSQTANHVDTFRVELWFFGASANPSYPYTVELAPTTYTACEVCLTYREGCAPTGVDCENFFLAQSGSVTFTQADRDRTAGQFKGSGTNVRFVEWNETTDRPVPDGRCVELASFTLDASWPAASGDAGTDAGATDGGATDAGAADAGDTDAGAVDAGDTDAGAADAGDTDAGATDAGATDAGSPDAG